MPTASVLEEGSASSRPLEWGAALAALAAALLVNHWTGRYVDRIAAALPPARDLLFELIPMRDLPVVHVWGFMAFLAAAAAGTALHEPRRRVPFILWAYALLIATRAVFTVLTPLGLPAEAPSFEHYPIRGLVGHFDFRHTLFFSGHTAFPFMGFLIFRTPWVRWTCLAFSLILASSVLLARLHYSIDVGAAFFIAYGVRRLAAASFERLSRLGRPA